MAQKKKQPLEPTKKPHHSTTSEAREAYLVSLAYDVIEQRLLNGTASAQETTTIIKLGSEKAQEEIAKLRNENDLLKAKTEAIHDAKDKENIYERALIAMRTYTGMEETEDDPYILGID